METMSPAMRTRRKLRAGAQESMLSCFDVSQHKISARTLTSRKYLQEVLAAVLNGETIELMEYCTLIGNTKYCGLWQHLYGNEVGRLAQGMQGRIEGTDTIFFIHK